MAFEHEAGLADAAHSRTAAPPAVESEDERAHGLAWPEAARIAFVAFSAAAVWFQVWEPIAGVSPIGIVGLVVGGWPIFREALVNTATDDFFGAVELAAIPDAAVRQEARGRRWIDPQDAGRFTDGQGALGFPVELLESPAVYGGYACGRSVCS